MLTEARVVQAGETRSSRLESLRGLAALSVVTAHVYGTHVFFGRETTDTYLHRLVFAGGLGVSLFFALSGFLLYRPFARRDFGGGRAVAISGYFRNRALRILPLYFAVITILVLLIGTPPHSVQWLRFATFSQTFTNDGLYYLDGPTWSLVDEIHFYILLPAIAFALAWLSRGHLRRAACALIVLGLASLTLKFSLVNGNPTASQVIRFSFPVNFGFFVPGMLLAMLQVQWVERPSWLRSTLARSSAWLAAAIVLWALASYDYGFDFAVLAASFLTIGACVLPLRRGLGLATLEWRPLALVGVISYSIYIWHDPIVGRLPRLSFLPSNLVAQLLVALPLSIAVGAISYALLEAPWLRLRRRWVGSSPSGPSQEQAALRQAVPGAGRDLRDI
jgi:peptidoglycan/LPS O-acetylase OafA/YrhL